MQLQVLYIKFKWGWIIIKVFKTICIDSSQIGFIEDAISEGKASDISDLVQKAVEEYIKLIQSDER